MPKAKVEKVTPVDANFEKVEVEVGERGTTKIAEFTRPTFSFFKEYILSLSDTPDGDSKESPHAEAYRLFIGALDRRARMSVYESIAAESTMISVGKDKIDILSFPLGRLVGAVNGMRTQVSVRSMAGGDTEEARAAAERSVGYGPWRVAARKLTEAKFATESNPDDLYASTLTLADGVDPKSKLESK